MSLMKRAGRWSPLTVLCTTLAALPAMADREARTPIRHVVVIFQENVSFDHYFAHLPATPRTHPASRAFTPARTRRRSTG